MKTVSKRLVPAIALLLAALPIGAWAQTDFPNRRIHIVVPYPAGGIVDVMTRIVAEKLSTIWGQPIVVESKPGANANLGPDLVARAEPDGYTWGFFAPFAMVNPRLYPNLRWSEKSFTGVAVAAWTSTVVVVHPANPAHTLAEFVALARKQPDVFNYGNPGIGSSNHLNTELFMRDAGIKLHSVPYKGQPAAILDLMADRIHVKLASIGLVAEQVKAGQLRALAVIGNQRSALLPDVPTMTEAGYPASNLVAWYGFVVPKDTPAAIVDKINAGFAEALADANVRRLFAIQGLEPAAAMTAPVIAATIASDTERYAKLIAEIGLKVAE